MRNTKSKDVRWVTSLSSVKPARRHVCFNLIIKLNFYILMSERMYMRGRCHWIFSIVFLGYEFFKVYEMFLLSDFLSLYLYCFLAFFCSCLFVI